MRCNLRLGFVKGFEVAGAIRLPRSDFSGRARSRRRRPAQ